MRSFRQRLVALIWLAGGPSLLLSLALLLAGGASTFTLLLVAFVGGLLLAYCHYSASETVNFQLRSLTNLVDAVVSGDYSLRGRAQPGDPALSQLIGQLNTLSGELQSHRFEQTERQHLLTKIVTQIEVAIVTVDPQRIITLANPAAHRLLAVDDGALVGMRVSQWLDAAWLRPGSDEVRELGGSDRPQRVRVAVDSFREDGETHYLIFISNVHQLLRVQQLEAWRDLVRVLSHEINNSLAPIASISQSLAAILRKETLSRPEAVREGLAVIGDRAGGLRQFVDRYGELARLPRIHATDQPLAPMLKRLAPMFPDRPLEIAVECSLTVHCDAVQMEQVWINLLKNAAEAMRQQPATLPVQILAQRGAAQVVIRILDQGPGIVSGSNLFVPFFTTKEGGSGIGLPLSRQIVEAHGGRLAVANRQDGTLGCQVTVWMPAAAPIPDP